VRLSRTGRRLFTLTVVAVLVTGVYLAVSFVQVLVASRHDDRSPADAIVVLGAAQYNGEPSGALRGRLDHALELYEAGVADVLVPTGGGLPGDVTTEGLTGYSYLRDRGVPEEAILVEVGAADTYEALSAARVILEQRGLARAVLVSDPYHNRRLEAIAAEVGLDAAVSPTDAGSDLFSVGRETVAVAIGRLIGYRRLSSL
jgi:uncharacterized SAM-binding protein YcdF (DUF218 family)